MLVTMVVGLFTSRVVLQTLGVVDYGVYSVVGGVISLFTFINGAMISSTQRYLNFELGVGNVDKLRLIFRTALQIHIIIAIVIIILGETIGLWFLTNKLIIPGDRIEAALWVYQFSILSCAVGIISVPYYADIIAHEKMHIFAYVTIFDALMKLCIAYSLYSFANSDKLIVYSLLGLLLQLSIAAVYVYYCHTHFEEPCIAKSINSNVFNEMFHFAGWCFLGSMSAMLSGQGINMLLNIFFGPVVNAARGIAVQVQCAVQAFVGNFQMALNPQITKTYAIGDLTNMHLLIFRSSRFSFFLLFMIVLPIILETKFILTLWLGNIPNDTIIFVRVLLCISLIYTISNPCITSNQATGNVKKYQIVVGSTLLLILPISYVVLKLNAPAYMVFVIQFIIEIIAQLWRMIILRKQINLPLIKYVHNVFVPIIATAIFSIVLPLLSHIYMIEGVYRLTVVIITSIMSVSLFSFVLGMTKGERVFIISKFRNGKL